MKVITTDSVTEFKKRVDVGIAHNKVIYIALERMYVFIAFSADVAVYANIVAVPEAYGEYLDYITMRILNNATLTKYIYDIRESTGIFNDMSIEYSIDSSWHDAKAVFMVCGMDTSEVRSVIYAYNMADTCKRRGEIAKTVFLLSKQLPPAYDIVHKAMTVYRAMESHGIRVTPFSDNYYTKTIKNNLKDDIFYPAFSCISDKNTRTTSNFFSFPKQYRSNIIAREGMWLAEYDYNCAEARIIAYLANDKVMQDLFDEGVDLHTYNARIMWQLDDDSEVDPNMRSLSKELFFSWLNGMSINGIRKKIDFGYEDVRALLNKLKKKYKKTVQWFDRIQTYALKDAYISNMFGRLREFTQEEIITNEASVRRQAPSFVIQSTLTDFKLLALIKIYAKYGNILCGERTDSVLIEINDDDKRNAVVNDVKSILERPMESLQLTIPVKYIQGKQLE
jgi:hypothetical protein